MITVRSFFYLKPIQWLVLIKLLFSSVIVAATEINRYESLRPALAIYKLGNHIAAAENWVAVATDIQKRSIGQDAKALKKAGLASIAATIAFNNANDARSYASWAQAIQYFLQGQTKWEDERKQLGLQLKDIVYALKLAPTDQGKPPLSGDELLLLELEQTLALTEFTGPRPGLQKSQPKEGKPEITITRDYYARPLKVIEEEQKEGQIHSKYATYRDKDSNTVQSKPVTHGHIGSRLPPVITEPLTINQKTLPETKGDTGKFTSETNKKTAEIKTKTQSATIDRAILNRSQIAYSAQVSTLQQSPLQVRGGQVKSIVDQHKEVARRAWRYFETNEQSNTGLYNGSNGYPNATLWDIASGLAALVSAQQLGLIDRTRFNQTISLQLQTLSQLPLYENVLPNREYNTQSGKMIDLRNRPSNQGSGWSAVDIGRLLIWLRLVREWYPEFSGNIDKVIARWDLSLALNAGELQGALFDGSDKRLFQEGRFGYEHYAAIGFLLWDFDVRYAMDLDNIEFTEIYNIKIPYDKRDHSYLTSDPFILLMLETDGIDKQFQKIIQLIYQVQKERWLKENILTAQGESRLTQEPWFVYNTIYANQKPWGTLSHSGQNYPEFSSTSTLVAFAWSALIPKDGYIETLKSRVIEEFHPKFGYYSGIFTSGSRNPSLEINTNAVILESLLYLKRNHTAFINVTEKTN